MSKSGGRNHLTAKCGICFRFIYRIIIRIQLPGGAYRDRTDDPLLAKQVLSQLS